MNADEKLIMQLVNIIPSINVLYQEHLKDYDELLPHVLMGDIARFAKNIDNAKHDMNIQNEIKTLINIFNEQMKSGKDSVKELISVSFLENIEENESCFILLKNLMGAELIEELQKK